MENKAQKKVLIAIAILLIVIAVLAYVLSLFSDQEENLPPTTNEPDASSEVVRDEIAELEEEAVFFGVQKIINDYYNFIFEENTNEILNMLDPEYLNRYQINSSDLYAVIGSDYGITSYIAKNIYYNPDSSVTYYFVSGYLTTNSVMGDEYEFYDQVSFLIIVDESTNQYVLNPIQTTNLLDYAESYDIVDRNIENGNSFQTIRVTEENKLSTYLNEFITFLIYNPREAYDLLDEDTQQNYQGYSDFEGEAFNLYDSLSSRIFSYSSNEDDDVVIYEIVDNNQNKITIYEYGIMNYRISL